MRTLLGLLMVVPALAMASPDPPKPLKVKVEISIKPLVGPTAPTLVVEVVNGNKTDVPLTRFSDPVCFARHYLVIELTGPNKKPVTSTATCAVKDWPGTDDKIAAGSSTTIEVPMAALFPKLAKGRYEMTVDWDPAELEKARPGTGVRASQTSFGGSVFAIAKPLSTFKITRGKTVKLPGGHALTFRAHGHKSVGPGDKSPLIIRGEIAVGKAKKEEFDAYVYPDENRLFDVRGLVFELGKYEYDGFMELTFFGRIALE